jgi:hypothetical protein
MQIPEEFYEFCLYLHQDSFDLYGREPQELAAGPLRFVPKEKRAVLRAFIDQLLTGNYSDEQLQKIYRSTDADISFPEGLRYFLGLVRDAIDRSV